MKLAVLQDSLTVDIVLRLHSNVTTLSVYVEILFVMATMIVAMDPMKLIDCVRNSNVIVIVNSVVTMADVLHVGSFAMDAMIVVMDQMKTI
jgi:hypothetical protein